MDAYDLADVAAHLSELVGRAEAGETVEIRRRGRTVARLVPPQPERKPIDFDELARVRRLGTPGGLSVEDMRRRDLL